MNAKDNRFCSEWMDVSQELAKLFGANITAGETNPDIEFPQFTSWEINNAYDIITTMRRAENSGLDLPGAIVAILNKKRALKAGGQQ